MQIAATLVKGKARIKFDAPKGTYSLARAQQSFKSLVHIHEKNGETLLFRTFCFNFSCFQAGSLHLSLMDKIIVVTEREMSVQNCSKKF